MRDVERSRPELRADAVAIAHKLGRDPRVRLVYGYGSVHRDDAAPPRDLDLAILTDPPLSPDEVSRLGEELAREARLRVDLVSLNHAPIVLAHEIVEDGVCLHAASPEIETDFVVRTRAQWWDFQPYREEQWRLAGERLAERARGS